MPYKSVITYLLTYLLHYSWTNWVCLYQNIKLFWVLQQQDTVELRTVTAGLNYERTTFS